MAYTTVQLLESIEKRAAIPISQSTFTNPQILGLASEAIETELLPKIIKAKQDFYITYEDISLSKGTGDNHSWIRIPFRAVGQSIVSISNPINDCEIDASSFWVEGSKIYFENPSLSSYRIRYYLRPSKLVETSSVGTITAIDTATGIVTVSSAPSDYTTSITYDFVRANPGYDTLAINKTCSLVSSNNLTFTASDLPSELAVGDYLCASDESPVPQIPVEWFAFLAQLVAVEILTDLGDHGSADKAASRLKRMEDNVLSLISPRIENKPKAIIRPFDYDRR